MSFDVCTKLYKTLVEPVLFYGGGIWGHSNWKEVQTVQNKACRLFSGRSSNASNIAVRGDMGFCSAKYTGMLETFRLLLVVLLIVITLTDVKYLILKIDYLILIK